MIDPQQLRDLAVRVAMQAADLVRTLRSEGVSVAGTKSSSVDVVTEIDRASEALVRRLLLQERPDDAVLGEEDGATVGTTGVRWIVDPVDGTVNLLYGLPEYAVSIAVEVDGVIVAGAVVDVAKRSVYASARGHGSTRDGRPIRVRGETAMAQRLMLTGFGYQPEVRAHQGACVARLLPRVRDIRRMGSCALDLCHIAEGLADGYVEEGPQQWDWAAGSLIVEEAGGRFALLPGTDSTREAGSSPRRVVVAAPRDGWDELISVLAETGFVAEHGTA